MHPNQCLDELAALAPQPPECIIDPSVEVALGSMPMVGKTILHYRILKEIGKGGMGVVYEVNEVEDVLFFVMQYVDGKTLKKFIGGRPLPLDQALEFSLEIVDALAEAHRRNVLHRDIKSSNIMLNERNQPKILDFGLAKLIQPVTSSESPHT